MAGGKKGSSKEAPAKGGKAKAQQTDTTAAGGKKKGAQSISVRHILCDKHSKREEALAKLRSGVSWNDVCTEFAIEKARTGGSLGWKKKGELVPEFEEVAFAMESMKEYKGKAEDYPYGQCKSEFGYHIIMLDDKK
ncbi:hypothetical protein BX600DRAFT_386160 [Xylariales sp. PMI_506]|nr:hypothetical protein BX600DRAFT_386160 [Xylariales sp. PMI_506]